MHLPNSLFAGGLSAFIGVHPWFRTRRKSKIKTQRAKPQIKIQKGTEIPGTSAFICGRASDRGLSIIVHCVVVTLSPEWLCLRGPSRSSWLETPVSA
jgi:hypothetical protein